MRMQNERVGGWLGKGKGALRGETRWGMGDGGVV